MWPARTPTDADGRNGLPPPSAFRYRDELRHQQESRRVISTTVYGSAWSPAAAGDGGRYLAACSNFGVVCVWDVLALCVEEGRDEAAAVLAPSLLTSEDALTMAAHAMDVVDGNSEGPAKKAGRDRSDPVLRIQATQGTLYDLEFHTINSTPFLIVSGDSGVLLFKWDQILCELQQRERTDPIKTLSLSPTAVYAPHPSATERQGVEVNCVSCDETLNILYAAAGDLFGCYRWDVETGRLLGTLADNYRADSHTDYLHTVKAVPGSHHILTGGEDGKMGIWNGKDGKLVEMLNCRSSMDQSKALINADTNQVSSGGKDWSWGDGSHLWVSGIDVDSCGNWAVVCGGAEGKCSSVQKTNGFLTIWNLPTRTLTSGYATRESLQSVAFLDEFDKIVSVGNESVVSYWARSKASREERAWTKPPSAFTVSVNSSNGMMAVGGASDSVDCFSDVGNRAFSMLFH